MVNKFDVGLIVLTLLVSGTVVLQLTDQVRLRIDADKTSLYVPHEEYPWIWVVGGREYNRLFDGSSIMNRDKSGITIDTFIDNATNGITVVRKTPYQRGPVIVDTYQFNGSLKDVKSFPVSHQVEIFNASGKFYRYSVDELTDVPPRTKLSGETELSFGRNVDVSLQENYRWAWLGWPYGSDSLSAQYNLASDYEVFNVRLFDPPTTATVLTLDGDSADKTYELGTPVQLIANVTDGGTPIAVNVYISIDAPGYGANYTNGTSPFSYNWTSIAGIIALNGSETSKNYTFSDNSTLDYFYRLSEDDELLNASVDIRGFISGGDYAHDFTIDIGDDGSNDVVLYGDMGALSATTLNESDFNGSASTVDSSWEPDEVATTRVAYIRSPLVNASTATLNLTSNPTANATTSRVASWSAGYEYGGLGFSDVYECWQPVGGFIGDRFYQIGGKCLYGNGCEYNCSIYYDISTNSFTQTTDLPYSMTSGCAVSYDNDDDGISEEIYIFGGQDSGSTAISTAYKLNSSGFTSLTSMTDARILPVCTLVDDIVYVVGEADNNATVLKYNITGNSWSTGGTLNNIKGASAGVAQFNSTHLLVWGGDVGWGDIEYYELSSGTATDTTNDFRGYGFIGASFRAGSEDYDVYSLGGYCAYAAHCGEASHYINKTYKFNATSEAFEEASEAYSWSSGATNKGLYACGWSSYNGSIYASPTNIGGAYSQELMRFYFFPKDLTFLVGSETTPAWNHSGSLLAYEYRGSDASGGDAIVGESGDFATQLNEYIQDCTTSPYCDVPVYINSGTAGTVTFQDLNVTYTIDDVALNTSAFSGTGWYNETMNLSASGDGIVELSDIKIHKDGHENITITANYYGNGTYDASNDSQVALLYFSDWDYVLAEDYLEFIPKNPTAQNVIPYGQTTTIPILNITTDTVNIKNMSWDVLINETYNEGTGNDGTLTNGPTWNASGYSGYAITFDGTNDYVNCSMNVLSGINQSFSFSVWLKIKVNGTYMFVINHGDGEHLKGGAYCRVTNAERLQCIIDNGAGGTHNIQTANDVFLGDNAWHHMAFVFNIDTNRAVIYKDAAIVTNSSFVGGNNLTSAEACIIGAKFDGSSIFFNGSIDDVQIYDRALSVQEI